MNYVRSDIYSFVEMNYVRVNLSYGYYGGFSSGGLHATGSIGYNDSSGTVTSYDPWSLRGSSDACTSTSYSYSQTLGCSWTMPQTNYFLAMDRSGAGTNPVWW